MAEDDLFDTSDYQKKNHFLYSEKNMKVLGKMKDECAGTPFEEFVGLRPKMYSLVYGGKEQRTAKCITRTCQRKMKHEHYKRRRWLSNRRKLYTSQRRAFLFDQQSMVQVQEKKKYDMTYPVFRDQPKANKVMSESYIGPYI